MRSFANIAITAWLVLMAAACAKTNGDDNLGTNTNWLRRCGAQAECRSGEACLCGVCTVACDESAECSDVNASTTCEPINATACHMSASAGSACLQGCDENSDCTALEDGECVAGLCVPTPADPVEDAGGPPIDRLALTRIDAEIQITEAYTDCDTHRDCVLVGTSCNGCCGQGAIDSTLTDTYEQHMEPACAGYQGGICDCSFPDVLPRCVDSHCEAVPRAELPCYAPGVNEDQAYEEGAVGCACEQRDQSICTGPVALICDESPGGPAWAAVQDGPCGEPEPDPSCSSGTLVPSAETCLAEFFYCYRVPDGQFCGTNPDP